MSPSAPCYAARHLQPSGENTTYSLSSKVCGGQGWSSLPSPHLLPPSAWWQCPCSAQVWSHPLYQGRGCLPGQPTSTGCGWSTSQMPGPVWASLLVVGAQIHFLQCYSYDNLYPPRLFCTPASLLALSPLNHIQLTQHTHMHTHHAFLSSELGYSN